MMPAFPPSPLKFRTAGFPRYGFKAGISDAAFPAHWFAIALRALCFHRDSLLCVRDDALMNTSVRADSAALPQGLSLRSGLFCPGPSSLSQPHPPQLRAHPDFTAWRLIRDAFAVHIRICLGAPRLVLSFHQCSFTTCRPLPTTGNPSAVYTQYFTENAGLQLAMKVSAFPSSSHSDSGEGCFSRLDYSSLALRPVALLALLSELTRFASSHRGRLLPGFQRFGHPLRRRISLQCQLGNLHWRDFHPQDHRLASLHHSDTTIPLLGVQKVPTQPASQRFVGCMVCQTNHRCRSSRASSKVWPFDASFASLPLNFSQRCTATSMYLQSMSMP
jgi:hypothetical protein